MRYMITLAVTGYISALFALGMQRKHLLGILLRLEAIIMRLFIILLAKSSFMSFSREMALILITLGACEARLGLSVLVSMIRVNGNDYVRALAGQKC